MPTFPILKHSGKIDKVKLGQNYKTGAYEKRSIVTSGMKRETNDEREIIRRIFARNLALSETAVENGEPDDNADFFLIGGDSILVSNQLVK